LISFYDIKIQASQLLMDNIENTFVTPVFNGSASLRDAAGQLIENVTKSVRRKQTVDDAYMESLYADITSLHRLDQIQAGTGKADLGPLPQASVILLVSLGGIWVLLGVYMVLNARKNKKNRKEH